MDVYAQACGVVDDLLPVLERLVRGLRRKSREFATVVKAGNMSLGVNLLSALVKRVARAS